MRYLAGVESVCSQRSPISFWTSPQALPQYYSLAAPTNHFSKAVVLSVYVLMNICAVSMCTKHPANHHDLYWFRPERGQGAWVPIPPLDPPLRTVFHYNPA